MKIAVTSCGTLPESPVEARFGRAPFFIVVDTESGTARAHDNAQSLGAAQGAGVQAAEAVCRLGAEAVITGHCGPKAFRALRAAGIQVVLGAAGTVAEAVGRFEAGELVPADAADMESHWA